MYYDIDELSIIYSTVNDVTYLTIVPLEFKEQVKMSKLDLSCFNNPYSQPLADCMVQVALEGDIQAGGFYAGHSYKNSEASKKLKMYNQIQERQDNRFCIYSFLQSEQLNVIHTLVYYFDSKVIEIGVSVKNISNSDISIESLNSFNLSALSPFQEKNNPEQLFLHKIRTNWSSEGRLCTEPVCNSLIEDSWSFISCRQDKIYQTGSFPARNYYPIIALEDRKYNVTWAVELNEPASWVLEAHYNTGWISLNGGLTDFVTGHFKKCLKPNESFETEKAFLSVVKGSFDDATSLLVKHKQSRSYNTSEEELPITYNEYCYSWGDPYIKDVALLIDKSYDLGAKYFVLDCGWFSLPNAEWNVIGDWNVDAKRFPHGLIEVSNKCHERGMKAGIWFEFEGVTESSNTFLRMKNCLLTKDGHIIQSGGRHFLDFRKPEVVEYLEDLVINIVKNNNFDYIKIDYNESIGVGCDGADSLGEGLRKHIIEVSKFFKNLKELVPNILIELCAAGGFRNVSYWMNIADVVSFSDAHETDEGAIIAANLHRLIPPRMLQVWSVVKPNLISREIVFSMCKSFLGRMCISGDILGMSEVQNILVKKGIELYKSCTPILKSGKTYFINNNFGSYRYAHGVLTLIRVSDDNKKAIFYAFSFGEEKIETSINDYFLGAFIKECYCEQGVSIILENNIIHIDFRNEKNNAAIILLERE